MTLYRKKNLSRNPVQRALCLVPVLTMVLHSHAQAEGLQIDGIASESEWANASQIDDLRLTQPESGAKPNFVTRVRYLSTPEGLAFFFECDQDPAVHTRRASRQARDNNNGSDRVNVMLDFDGVGQAGYNFTVSRSNSIDDATISNENLFNGDWDGYWLHEVKERSSKQSPGWDAEILIPWSSALMRQANASKRTIGVYFDRVIGATETRAAYPAISFFKSQFLSQFARLEVAAHSKGLLRFYPYLTVSSNFISGQTEYRSGADIAWKPSSSFQLTAAINPDFGQVEADDLVVNFDAIETFFSDKRPFFTENQAAFVRQSPEEEQLIYTRRVGAGRDDGQGVSDIDAALKISGSGLGLDYGLFGVQERDPDRVGRSVSALRIKKPNDFFDVGYLGTYVERPFLDRFATVHAVDLEWANANWRSATTLLQSQIREKSKQQTGLGGFSSLIYKPDDKFLARGDWTRYGNQLDYNDLGFQRRANWSFYETQLRWFKNDFSEASPLRSRMFGFDTDTSENSAGRNLSENFEVKAEFGFKSGASSFAEINLRTPLVDDLISRNNGAVRLAGGGGVYGNYNAARRGNFQLFTELYLGSDAYVRREGSSELGLNYFPNDDLTINTKLSYGRYAERLLWRQNTLFGRFASSQSVSLSWQAQYFVGTKHELRVKAQWLGVTGRDAKALRLQTNERLSPANDAIPDFAIGNFGMQLRYRYKINQESDFFVVYSRGGESFERDPRDSLSVLLDSTDLRDSDQFLVKLRYAF